MCRSWFVAVGGLVLALLASVLVSAPASAATCTSVASFGIRICGNANQEVLSYRGYDYARTRSFTWSVKRTDRTLRIAYVKVRMGANSGCTARPKYSECRNFNDVQNVNRASIGTTSSVPSWRGKWGLVTGLNKFQRSLVVVRWCRGTRCQTSYGPSLGVGSTG